MTSNTEAIRIGVVDDHAMMRTGIIQTLQEYDGLVVVGEGGSAADALRIAHEQKPEIMLLDINMPGGGLNALDDIVAAGLPVKVVMLTVFDSHSNVQRAMQNGAAGFVPKGIEGDELAKIVRDVSSGRGYVNAELAARLFREERSTVQEDTNATRKDFRLSTLTDRESSILALIAKGNSNAEIASSLGLTEATVKQYSSFMFKKLKVKNRTEAALLASQSQGF